MPNVVFLLLEWFGLKSTFDVLNCLINKNEKYEKKFTLISCIDPI